MTDKINGPTRRQAIAGAVMISASMAMRPAQLCAETEEISHTAESIHQETQYKASPKRVFDALTDTSQFDKIIHIASGMNTMSLGNEPTAISRELGGPFTLFGGHIIGRQIELVPNERIVQAWRVVDWAPGIYSVAKFELQDQGSGTKIVFDHTGFPQGKGEHLAAGWKSHYWDPLEKFLAETSK
jgi:activator of HSP90 ATPase